MKKVYRTNIPFRNKHKKFDLTYGEVYPVFSKFVIPGDIWKLRAGALIRYQPMLAPVMSECTAYFRFFFVPLRLVEDKLEEIITGSKEGSLITGELPKCRNIFEEFIERSPSAGSSTTPSEPVSSIDTLLNSKKFWKEHPIIHKNSFLEAMALRPDNVTEFFNASNHTKGTFLQNHGWAKLDPETQAAYWYKAYCRVIWDFFRDENYQSFDGDFDKFYDYMLTGKGGGSAVVSPTGYYGDEVVTNGWYYSNRQYAYLQDYVKDGTEESYISQWKNGYGGYGAHEFKLWFADLNKDYFMSSLPWIMKGVQPTINSVMHADFSNAVVSLSDNPAKFIGVTYSDGETHTDTSHLAPTNLVEGSINHGVTTPTGAVFLKNALNNNTISDGGFTAQDIRDMFAETRIFERLARTGSRYVEYLEANFGIAPRDDTLQRPLYLGGFTQPIVTTEVIQNGGSSEEVGTLRGHGISNYSNRIKPFSASEFGVIFGLMYVKPKTEYLYQERREFSYKKRFDFFNPSLQLLSEQQVHKRELFVPGQITEFNTSDDPTISTENKYLYEVHPMSNEVLGYQGMYNELRYDNDIICRSFARDLSYWTQSINFANVFDRSNPLRSGIGEDYRFANLNGVNICIGTYLKSLLKPFNSDRGDFKPMLVDFVWSADCYRAMVRNPVPGLVDHH